MRKGVEAVEAVQKRNALRPTQGQHFKVNADNEGGEGCLKLCVGDEHRVLDCDEDAIHIEVLGDPNNLNLVS